MLQGIKNIIKWWPIIWKDRDFDWAFLTSIMEFKFRNMSQYFKEAQIIVASDKVSRECLICAELLKRIEADNRYDLSYKEQEALNEFYLQLLAKQLTTHLRSWWD